MRAAEARDRAETGLGLVGLNGFGNRLPSELSGGQQQRVAVARAIVLEPEVLLLDEPLSNLDAKLRRHVREEIRRIQQQLGLTAVYVTHDQEEAMSVSDRIVVMSDAEIAQEGSPSDLYERPASAFIADFIGDANLIGVEVVKSQDDGAVIEIQGKKLKLDAMNVGTGPAKMVLRPHHLKIDRSPHASSFPAEVTYAAYLGNQLQYTLEGDLRRLFVIAPPKQNSPKAGENVFVSFARMTPGSCRVEHILCLISAPDCRTRLNVGPKYPAVCVSPRRLRAHSSVRHHAGYGTQDDDLGRMAVIRNSDEAGKRDAAAIAQSRTVRHFAS